MGTLTPSIITTERNGYSTFTTIWRFAHHGRPLGCGLAWAPVAEPTGRQHEDGRSLSSAGGLPEATETFILHGTCFQGRDMKSTPTVFRTGQSGQPFRLTTICGSVP